MAKKYVCRFCDKVYQSRSGMRRHLKAKHSEEGLPAIPVAVEMAGDAEGSEAGRVPASKRSEDRPASDRPACRPPGKVDVDWLPGGVFDKEAKGACKALGISEGDVMAYRVYREPFKVVIIEGPVGQKRVWHGD